MESAETLGLLIVLLLLYAATLGWGVDSTDGPDSPEWERRRDWRSHGGVDRRAA
jgi:hypothetical protein